MKKKNKTQEQREREYRNAQNVQYDGPVKQQPSVGINPPPAPVASIASTNNVTTPASDMPRVNQAEFAYYDSAKQKGTPDAELHSAQPTPYQAYQNEPTAPAPYTPPAQVYGGAYDAANNQAYQQALSALQEAQKGTPSYQGTYEQQLQDLYDQITNREKFSYDLNADPLYNQYRNQYVQQGRLAMMDTMGQAAAMTGGYGNSYAATAGNQAYQGYLSQLNNVMPELYGMALDQYNNEGNALLTQYGMIGDLRADEYSRYQDALDRYWQNINYLQGQADEAYNRGYDSWMEEYNRERDRIADEQWQKEFDEKVRQYNQDYALSQQRLYSSGGGSGGGSGTSYKTATDAERSKLASLYTKGGDAAIFDYMEELDRKGYDVEGLYAWLTANYKYQPGSTAKSNSVDGRIYNERKKPSTVN